MPQVGHGLAAIGLAAASAGAPRSHMLRSGWVGLLLLGSYLPDVMEWISRLAGFHPPHSAPASLPCLAVYVALAWIACRWAGERSPVVFAILASAIASHTLLDALTDGIPLWWPISEAVVGNQWLDVWDFPLWRLLLREAAAYCPLVGLGLCIAIARRRIDWRLATAAGLTAAAALAMGWNVVWLAPASTLAVAILALVACRPRLSASVFPSLAWAAPVLLLGAAQVAAWAALHRGEALFERGEYAAAQEWFWWPERLRIMGIDGVGYHNIAECRRRLGREREALEYFHKSLAERPGGTAVARGLMDFYLTATDESLRDARAAAALAKQLPDLAINEAERRKMIALRDQVLSRPEVAAVAGSGL